MHLCATREELTRFVGNKLESPQRETLNAHIEDCVTCRQLLEQITSQHQKTGPTLSRRYPRIDGYTIIREIGRGGMGVVYEAQETKLSRRVAVKVLPGAALLDAAQRLRFEREAKAAARLHHTNIVPVFGVGRQDEHAYFVMQYIEGSGLDVVLTELRRLIQTGSSSGRGQVPALGDDTARTAILPGAGQAKPSPIDVAGVAMSLATGTFLAHDQPPPKASVPDASSGEATLFPPQVISVAPPRSDPSSLLLPGSSEISSCSDLTRPYFTVVARIGIEVAEAMDYANRQGVLHRDIKPSNLLLDTKGKVWVADFGLAKTAEADDMTQTGQLVGTIRFMAPERFQGQCDARSDVYSLGLTLYELVALRPAFEGTDRHELIERIRRDEPAPLKRLAPKVPRDLETIIHKAIARDPTRRYATAGALADDLGRFLQDQPIRARRASRPERVVRWCRRNPWVAAFLAALGLGVIGSTWQAVRATSAERAARLAEATTRKERDRAESEAEIARAVNEFLNKDVLAQASAINQATRDTKPDPDLKVRTALDRAAGKIGEKFTNQPLVEASIRRTIGETYQQLGLYPQARPHFERELELRRQVLGDHHPDTFAAMGDLGSLFLANDKLTEAETFLVQAMQGLRQTRGALHPDTLQTMIAVAQAYRGQGKLADAERLLVDTVERFRTAGRDEQTEAIGAMNDLGMVYLDQKKFEQAERIIDRVVKIMKNRQGIEHPYTLAAMSNLALAYDARGKSAEAEKTFNDVLKTQRKVLGNKHPDTLISMIGLGDFYLHRSELVKAERLLLEALDGCRDALDGQHIMTTAALGLLASLYARQGKLEKLGPPLIEARDMARARWGPDDGLTAVANQSVALFFQARKEYAKAEPYFRELVAFRIKKEPESWVRFVDEGSYGACLLEQRKYAEAAPRLISAYQGMKAREQNAPVQERTFVKTVLDRIVQLYEAWGKKDKADEWRKKQPSPPGAVPPKSPPKRG